ncbi:hypothetical protein GDO78_002761 [Eleutherodactylus coqui]|uniref:BRCA1 associated RING domain 1 n=1 Tax=Eleutherodactylus coqui TaxID=57060 RepID=A0A8J6K6T7_ELECQ|nr:hypothetical protein GDO78_002761 [Eleutherodactylus coqui]
MPLSIRSGNRPADAAAGCTMKGLTDWTRTRTALLELQGRLRCSVCLSLLKEPVCLGGCEHVFCRTCVDGSVGNECPVCHTPAWVKDVQINRQLDNIIQLCSKLHNLLDKGKNDGNKMDLCQDASLKQSTTEGESKKKQIKMWFSPRRGKVRYVLEREENGQQISSNCEQAPLPSTYEFVSSPPIVEPAKKKTRKGRKTKKQQLEGINQKWGIGTENENTNHLRENNHRDSSRSVSFCSPPHVFEMQDDEDDEQESNNETNELIKSNPEKTGLKLENHWEENTTEINNMKENPAVKSDEPVPSGLLTLGALQETHNSCDQNQENGHKESQLDDSVEEQPGHEKSLQHTQLTNVSSGRIKREKTPRKRKHFSSASPNSSATKRPRKAKLDDPKSEDDAGGLGKVRKSPKADTNFKPHSTPDARRRSQLGSNIPTSPSNGSFAKKNHKGETMLHVASIKGNAQAVEELLKSGANPNVKDNAGWTPLHEACNHGHTDVVEVLLQHQALVNTTGYQNDSPLHDAVKNGHTAIVQLLLQHGASQDAVNIFGLRPVDYAETEEIKSALLKTQTKKQLCSPGPTQKAVQCREGSLLISASGLSASQRTELNKLVSLLKAEMCPNYTSSVTHIIVGEEPMLRTMKCMMGILSGCWILRCALCRCFFFFRGKGLP